MTWVDFTIIAVLAVSASIGIFRGFIKEAFSLVSLIAAVWVALTFFPELSTMLTAYISKPPIRSAIAFFILLILTLLLGGMLSHLAVAILNKIGLSGFNRFLGMIFGLLRGGIVVAFLVLIAEKTMILHHDAWQNALLLEHINPLVDWLDNLVPAELDKYMHPDLLQTR